MAQGRSPGSISRDEWYRRVAWIVALIASSLKSRSLSELSNYLSNETSSEERGKQSRGRKKNSDSNYSQRCLLRQAWRRGCWTMSLKLPSRWRKTKGRLISSFLNAMTAMISALIRQMSFLMKLREACLQISSSEATTLTSMVFVCHPLTKILVRRSSLIWTMNWPLARNTLHTIGMGLPSID